MLRYLKLITHEQQMQCALEKLLFPIKRNKVCKLLFTSAAYCNKLFAALYDFSKNRQKYDGAKKDRVKT